MPSDRVPRSSTSAQDTHVSLSGHPTSALDTPAPRSKPPQPIRDEIDKELAVTKDLNETPPPQPYKGKFYYLKAIYTYVWATVHRLTT